MSRVSHPLILESVIREYNLETSEIIGLTQPKLKPLTIRISPDMLAAGRAAFLRKRRKLDDLHQYFDCDLDSMIREIFRSMTKAA